ncbi:MAG: hypothetical protein PHQ80_03465 [Candidatus ainarchaeum sp.]|nr:hypothetical protein [Candidatus ainarchaeum sp.]
MDCAQFGVLCMENACWDSGGNYTGVDCPHGPEFDSIYYENATAECGVMEQRCMETGGMVAREGSCCLPSFALLLVLGFAARSRSFK